MHDTLFEFSLVDEDATARLATQMAEQLKIGDTLLLEGDVGAGKSAFARALIRARLGRMEDVPSPTFTLVQTYEDYSGDIWHCDLYRLTHPDEALELGLDEAFETAICVIEWPDRLGDVAPKAALTLAFEACATNHHVTLSGENPWKERLQRLQIDRSGVIDDFLHNTAWQDWARAPLAGDASARQYFRLCKGSESVILMDAPPKNDEDTKPFVQIAELLTTHGFTAPQILAHNPDNGLLLLSDLGQTDYTQWVSKHPNDEATLYKSAADVLLGLEALKPPAHLKRMTPDVGAEMIAILGPHYTNAPTDDLQQEMKRALAAFASEPSTLALRDYHAENLIWRSERNGLDRVGLLDFQDAFVAPAGYDLASLLRDARRDVSDAVTEQIISYFEDRTKTKYQFRTSLACLGVQRNLRILGVFARLVTTMGKPRYLDFMPRVWVHILNDLKDPQLSNLRQAILDTIPEPTADYLKGLKS